MGSAFSTRAHQVDEITDTWTPLKTLLSTSVSLDDRHPIWLALCHLNFAHLSDTELEKLIQDNILTEILTINVNSGNFKNLFVFFTRILSEFRENFLKKDTQPISIQQLLGLCSLCRLLLKHLCLHCSTVDCIFHLEHAPFSQITTNGNDSFANNTFVISDSEVDDENKYAITDVAEENADSVALFYKGTFVQHIKVYNSSLTEIRNSIVKVFEEKYPQDLWTIENRGFAFRDSTGDSFTLMDLPSHLHKINFTKSLAIIPLGIPRRDIELKYISVTAKLFRECCLLFYATLESLPSLSCIFMFCVHQELLNIMLTLFDKISPKEYIAMSQEFPPLDEDNEFELLENTIENTNMKVAKSLCAPPPYHSAHAQSVYLYYLYMQARQPLPLVPVPMISWQDSLTPSMCFVEAFLDVLGDDMFGCNYGSACKMSQVASHYPMETPSIAAKLLTYLLNAVWLSSQTWLSSHLKLLKSKQSLIRQEKSYEISVTFWLHSCLNIFVLLSYYPSPDTREKLATAMSFSLVPLKENYFGQTLNEMSDPNFFSTPNSSQISSNECFNAEVSENCNFSAKINFRFLFNALCSSNLSEQMLPILLQTLICKNRKFRLFCSTTLECENLLYKILELLHRLPSSLAKVDPYSNKSDNSTMRKPPLTPFATILTLTLFLLCQEKLLCERLQELEYEDVKWTDTTPLRKITLGSLVVLVINRLTSWCFAFSDDFFFNKLCGAILINIAPFTKRLHWYVADQLVALTSMISREIKNKLFELCNSLSKPLPTGFESMEIISTTTIPALCSLLSPNHLTKNIEILYSLIRLNPLCCYKEFLYFLNLVKNNEKENENRGDKVIEDQMKINLRLNSRKCSSLKQFLLLVPFMEYLIEVILFFSGNLEEDSEEASIEQVKSQLVKAASSLSFDHSLYVGYKRISNSSLLNLRYAFSETFESAAYYLPLMWKCSRN